MAVSTCIAPVEQAAAEPVLLRSLGAPAVCKALS
jgi:hypothetical protein